MFKCCLQETIAKSNFVEYFSEFVLEFWVLCGVSLAHFEFIVLGVQLCFFSRFTPRLAWVVENLTSSKFTNINLQLTTFTFIYYSLA